MNTYLWVKSEEVVVSLEKEDAQKFVFLTIFGKQYLNPC